MHQPSHLSDGTYNERRVADRRSSAVQFVPQSDQRVSPADEIDLVDLAVVLVRRWRVMLAVFVLTVGLGFAAAWLKGASYEYSAIVDIGQRPDGALLDSPDAVQASVRNAILPAVAATAEDDEIRQLAAGVRVEGIKGTGTVILRAIAPEEMEPQVAQLFGHIRQQLIAKQAASFDRVVKPLQDQAAARKAEVAGLSQELARVEAELSNASGQSRLVLIDRMARLQEARRNAQRDYALLSADIARTAPTRMSESPQRSPGEHGTSPALIVALSAVLGVTFAVFAAFLVEFTSRVQARLGA